MVKERILGFDLVRVVAIFVVIGIYHNFAYARVHYENAASTLSLVYTSLGAFTFLSAFLLSSKYQFKKKDDILSFYKKRIFRIWPLFFISSFALYVIHFNPLVPTLKGIVGLSPFWAPAPITMWYVAMLISLYILTPFIVRGEIKWQCLKACFVMIVLGIIQLMFHSVVPKTFNYYTVYLISLLLGRNFYEQTISFLSSKKTLILSVFWIILLFIVYITGNNWLKSITGVIGIIALINICILCSNAYGSISWFANMISTLSYASFCAYLFHREIIWALLRVKSLGYGWPVFLEVLLIGVPLTFMIAYLIQRLYDSFTNRIIK